MKDLEQISVARYKKESIAVSSGDHKMAALFFDKLFPLHSYRSIPEQILDKSFFKFGVVNMDDKDDVCSIVFNNPPDCKDCSEVNCPQRNTNCRDIFAKAFSPLIEAATGIPAIPIFNSKENLHKYFDPGDKEAFEVTLNSIPLVNTNTTSWEQIMEIRADKNAKRKLRNFRLFLQNNFSGKEPTYIADTISKSIEEYQDACKKHGLQLILSSLSQLLDSKSLLGAMTLTYIGILTNNTPLINLAAIGGATIEIGKIALNVVSKQIDFIYTQKNHELAYVFELRNRIDSK